MKARHQYLVYNVHGPMKLSDKMRRWDIRINLTPAGTFALWDGSLLDSEHATRADARERARSLVRDCEHECVSDAAMCAATGLYAIED